MCVRVRVCLCQNECKELPISTEGIMAMFVAHKSLKIIKQTLLIFFLKEDFHKHAILNINVYHNSKKSV